MEKNCKSCEQTKSIAEFYEHPRMADGHLNYCKDCVKSRVNKHRVTNIDAIRQYDKDRSMLTNRVKARAEYMQTPNGKEAHFRASSKYYVNHPDRKRVTNLLAKAVMRGKIQKLPCWVCGSTKVHGHHPDYDQPLAVTWLCAIHHKQVHIEAIPF